MKFGQLEEKYVENLLKGQFGYQRLIRELQKLGLIHWDVKFRERSHSDNENAGSFALDFIDYYAPPSFSDLKSVYEACKTHQPTVLSIHGVIEEHETRGLFWLRNKIKRYLKIKVIINYNFFSSDIEYKYHEEDIAKLNQVIKEYVPYIEQESGITVSDIQIQMEK